MKSEAATVDYREWIGREEIVADAATIGPVRRLLAMLDDSETLLQPGDALPPLWHWLYFLPEAPQSQLGHDGHEERGGFLPPVALPRRMFAGTMMTFHEPLPIEAAIRRVGRVVDVAEKSGRSGALVFVTVEYEIFAGERLCVEERQSIVYRDAGGPVEAPKALRSLPAPPTGAWVREIAPDPVLLFRYCALTFNGHRIHYDRPYVTEEEGYPGLIVQGPLLATLLMDLVRRNAERPVRRFEFRARAPIFDTAPFRVLGVPKGETVELTAERCDGEVAMSAEAVLG